jgi:enoyl-CoA hydratase/carnithine racemase
MDFATLLYEEREGVAIVTMNRPEVHNAFNWTMQQELKAVWTSLRRNDDVRVVVWTGAGDKAFCTGLDRGESIRQEYLGEAKMPKATTGGRVAGPFMYNDVGLYINPKQNDMWKPVVAAVNGMACAGALYMLGEADIIIAAEHATFFDPHVSYGMVSGYESMHLLQKLPLGETLRLALLGNWERISAARAHQVGLVSEVVPMEELLDRAMWVANAIASAPPLAIQGTMRAVWTAHELSRREALAQVSAFVLLGTDKQNIAEGQIKFETKDHDFRVR